MGLIDKAKDALLDAAQNAAPVTVTKTLVKYYANIAQPRPRLWSMAHNYPSWLGLSDRTYSGRHMDEDPDFDSRSKPSLDQLKNLFLKKNDKTYYSDRTSVLFMFFAQWLTDSFLRTDFTDHKRTDSNHEIDLCALYGLTQEKTDMLRCKGDNAHLLDFDPTKEEQFPPKLFDQSGAMMPEPHPYFLYDKKYIKEDETEGWQKITRYLHDPRKMKRITRGQTFDQVKSYYAMGLEHGNGTLGYVVLNVLMLRAHNKIAEAIRQMYCPGTEESGWQKGWDLDRVFHTARNVLLVILLKIVIEDYVGHIAGRKLKTPIGIADKARWGKSNRIAIEFNLLYRWHSLVPDTIKVNGKALKSKDYLRNPSLVEQHDLAKWLTEFSTQRAGRMGLHNLPDFFDKGPSPTTLERTLEVVMRASKLRPMNDYRKHYDLDPYRSFEELVGDQPDAEELVAELKSLYGDIDNVEWFVGLFAEKHNRGKVMGELMMYMVANDAFTQALTNPLLSENVFRPKGKERKDIVFSELGWKIMNKINSLQELSDYVLGEGKAICTFHVSDPK